MTEEIIVVEDMVTDTILTSEMTGNRSLQNPATPIIGEMGPLVHQSIINQLLF